MRGIPVLMIAAGLALSGCDNKTAPSQNSNNSVAIFTATLLPSNEIPAVANGENTGSGTVTVTVAIVRDGSNAITATSATFDVSVKDFPSTTSINIAHIHEGAATVGNGPIKVNTTLANGQVVIVNGGASFTRTNINVPFDVAQGMLDNPSGYYFNIHTSLNPSGVARGQLTRTQ